MIIAIDMGATFSKLVASVDGKISEKHMTESAEPSALAGWIEGLGLAPERIIVTGGKQKFFPDVISIAGKQVPVQSVHELEAIGRSMGQDGKRLILSVGTGTAVVKWNQGFTHMGGTGLGGGTVLGLGKLLTGAKDFEELEVLASKGSRKGADLCVGDILGTGIGSLPPDATASNFGKSGNVSTSDRALGCFTLVAETVAVLASQIKFRTGFSEIVVTGRIASSKQFRESLASAFSHMGVTVVFHTEPAYATALGALDAALP